MGNGIQITNTVILGLIAIPLTFFIIAVLLMSLALGSSQGLLNFSTVIYFFIWISSIVYFIFLFLSFKRCNIENKNFKWAFYLNLVWIVMAILLFLGMMIYVISSLSENIFEGADLTDKANNFSTMVQPILGLIYLTSFVVFMFGYFKNKKNLQPSPSPLKSGL